MKRMPMDAQAYVAMAKGQPITGRDDRPTDEDDPETCRKADWLQAGARIARELAKALGLQPGSFDVRTNPAGQAVSGDVHLHGEWAYVSLSQTCLGPDFGFMWRLCRGRKDYAGHANQWAKWDELLKLPLLAAKMRASRRDGARGLISAITRNASMTGNEPMKKRTKKETCPKCGQAFDPRKDQVVECPRCHVEGSTACCNLGGRNCTCVECEEKDTKE
jgi:hypothetical protein